MNDVDRHDLIASWGAAGLAPEVLDTLLAAGTRDVGEQVWLDVVAPAIQDAYDRRDERARVALFAVTSNLRRCGLIDDIPAREPKLKANASRPAPGGAVW